MRRPAPGHLLGVAALIVCSCTDATAGRAATTASPASPVSTVIATNAVIERVVDGDTVVIEIDGRSENARLIGIDTPETVKPDFPVECFGPEASAATKAWLPEGTPVRLERDVEARDDYGRLLVYLYRATDGMFVNLELVHGGYATVLTFPPNTAHVDQFVDAANQARTNGVGLWSGCTPQGSG